MKITFDKKDKKFARVKISEEKGSKVFKNPDEQWILDFGIGKKDDMNLRKLVSLGRKIVKKAKADKIEKIAIVFEDFLFPNISESPEEVASILAENFEMANYEFNQFKTKKDSSFVSEVSISGNLNSKIKKAFEKGLVIGEEVNKSRDLANTPGGDMTPTILAKKARESVKGLPVKVDVLDRKKMESLKMGSILGVTKGSDEEPAFIIMEYKGGGKEKPIVLVGKGITFDTGGLGIKPGQHMLGMHMDMSGGASVIHALACAAKLKLKRNVVALIPAAENMLSGRSYRPGDVLRSMSGQTIEVLHTDAEGRLVLADALTYAERYKPQLVVDVATLTGAAAVALGDKASAIFTKDEKIENKLKILGEKSGDYVWPLPLWEEYEEDIKGNFADWSNIHSKFKGEGGAIHAAIFLYQFAKNYPWAHIDIAPRMTENTQDNLSQGSVGAPVRLLVKLLEEF